MSKSATDFDPLVDQKPARYVVGIDLGTTNCAVAYVDTDRSAWQVNSLSIPQLVAAGVIEPRETLPAFHYEMTTAEAGGGAMRLPWEERAIEYAIGVLARDQGAKVPGRLIASAKSWLCHNGVDRTAPLLPWQGAADVTRLSPIDICARILSHIAGAWNHQFPTAPLSEQDVIITLPASFDEVARELTVRAAHAANLPRVILLEEPQAAFYAWLHKNRETWHSLVRPGQTILVCDIGGGTTDFTLIRVQRAGTDAAEQVQFHRIAVGNHLLLGGDNLDLALAHHCESQLGGSDSLTPRQWEVLVRACRRAKEQLLSTDAPDTFTIQLPGSGAKLIGGGMQVAVDRDATRTLLVDGFLPMAALDDRPEKQRSGFHEFGLPFATDPAISRYLAAFLRAHGGPVGDADTHVAVRPDVVLFNGGFFASPLLRERLLDVVTAWFSASEPPNWQPKVLENDRLDLAVARGAAYYGMVRRGEGVRIAANLARSYYIQVAETPPTAVCVVPGSTEPGQEIDLPERHFQLLVSQPVEFPLWVSSTRLTDASGEVVSIDAEQMRRLPSIRTVLKPRRGSNVETIPVQLHACLTEIGTIDLWCSQVNQSRSWKLQFDVRAATETDRKLSVSAGEADGVIEESTWTHCRSVLESVFGTEGNDVPEQLIKRLTKTMQLSRNRWPAPMLRRIWDALMDLQQGRQRSAAHEARWLNAAGFALRPGYGMALDDWRVGETWRHVQGKLRHHAPAVRMESTVLWRRIAGGLSKGQQQALADPLLSAARNLHRRYTHGGRGEDLTIPLNELVEVWRLLAALELLDVPRKVELGQILVALLPKRKLQKSRSAMLWALGRLGQRVPTYGPLNTVAPAATAERWLEAVLRCAHQETIGPMVVMQLARRTDDRYRDVSQPRRQEAAQWLVDYGAGAHLIELVEAGGRLDTDEQQQVFGESLPIGLRLE